MFEISDLKSKKLPELQEIAKDLNVPKFKTLKKLDLVYQILIFKLQIRKLYRSYRLQLPNLHKKNQQNDLKDPKLPVQNQPAKQEKKQDNPKQKPLLQRQSQNQRLKKKIHTKEVILRPKPRIQRIRPKSANKSSNHNNRP